MKKRLIGLVCMIALLTVGTVGLGGTLNAYALSTIGQTAEEYFLQTVQEFGYEQEVEYVKYELHNEKLQTNGFEFIFEVDNEKGFALMIECFDSEGNQLYDIMEIYFDSESPFTQAVGEKIYIKMFNYIDYVDGEYYDLATGEKISEEQFEQIVEVGFNYYGGILNGYVPESIPFNYKSDISFEFDYGLPSYFASNYRNSCSNIAGGIILGYYDIWYSSLIPNYTTNYYSNNKWKYYVQDDPVTDVINDLHFKMLTNVTNGTTVTNFRTGLTKYVSEKGRNISYTSAMSSSSFDYGKYKAQVHAGVPVAIFTGNYNLIDLDEFYTSGKTDNIATCYYSVNHTMVGSGYRDVSYNRNETVSVWSPVWYNPFRYVDETRDVNFRNDTYLRDASAFNDVKTGYMRLNSNAVIHDAFGVKIS